MHADTRYVVYLLLLIGFISPSFSNEHAELLHAV